MSISGISSTQNCYQTGSQSPVQGLGSNMQQLGAALQSGNLSSAQQAYSAVESSLTNIQGGSAGGSSGQGGSFLSQLQQSMSQIGSDLQSGNVSAASTAFTSLQQTLQGAAALSGQTGQVGYHHHHHGGGGAQATASSTAAGATIPASGSAGTTIDTSA